ncbi:hypothetical protein Emag_001792 [Eimeria magna]
MRGSNGAVAARSNAAVPTAATVLAPAAESGNGGAVAAADDAAVAAAEGEGESQQTLHAADLGLAESLLRYFNGRKNEAYAATTGELRRLFSCCHPPLVSSLHPPDFISCSA